MEILTLKFVTKQVTPTGAKLWAVQRSLHINGRLLFRFNTPRLILAIINKFC